MITCGPESSFNDWSVPTVNEGASLIPVILMSKSNTVDVSIPPFNIPPSSCKDMVKLAEPFAPVAGVNDNSPVVASTLGGAINIAALSFDKMVNDKI